MPDRGVVEPHARAGTVVYCYDGGFDGLMCCVFESYERREVPVDVLAEDTPLPLLLPVKAIETDATRAKRVLSAIPQKMGWHAMDFIRRAFLTCHPQKELLILRFLRLGFCHGPSVMNRLTDETVHALFTAVNHLDRETHLYKGFIRFSDTNGVLTAQIEPKNIVLPLVARHFAERYPCERFLIFDKTHGMVLMHQDRSLQICGADAYEPPLPNEEERRFRELWRLFYDTIEIKERRNPRCRMGHMPQRYWRCMTELAREAHRGGRTLPQTGAGRDDRRPARCISENPESDD
jgi:probable DNA metabolism protein